MTIQSYKALTSGALLLQEFETLLPILLLEDRNELLIREKHENKYIGIKMESSRERILRDMRKRTEAASEGFWTVFKDMKAAERKMMLGVLSS